MRWYLSSLLALLLSVGLASTLGAQAVPNEKLQRQTLKHAKKQATLNIDQPSAATPADKIPPQVVLRARPISCATLREGQPCYVKFSMSWESNQPITACLVSEQNEASACWENDSAGEFRKELYLSETTEWNLQNKEGDSFGSVKVRVAWVYKSRRVRRNWRLF